MRKILTYATGGLVLILALVGVVLSSVSTDINVFGVFLKGQLERWYHGLMGFSTSQKVFSIGALIAVLSIPYMTITYRAVLDRYRDVLRLRLGMDGIKAYYRAFRSRETGKEENYAEKFEKDFNILYGAKNYVIPVIVLTVVMSVAYIFMGTVVWGRLGGEEVGIGKTSQVLLFAILGGYTWVVFDFLERRYLHDLTPNSIYWMAFRMFMSAVIGFVFGRAFENSLLVAYFAGTVPSYTLRRYGRRFFEKQTGQEEVSKEAGDLSKLQGMSQTVIDRLQEEGIYTIQQLAYADPVELVIRSNFQYAHIVDWIDQALLYIYLPDTLDKLRPCGIRGALEFAHLKDNEALLEQVASVLGSEPVRLKNAIEQIDRDPHVILLKNMW